MVLFPDYFISNPFPKFISNLFNLLCEGATNSSGFSALPGGLRCHEGCTYFGKGLWGTFWSSTELDNETAWRFTLHNSIEQIEPMGGEKNFAKSVRCLRD